MITEKRITRMNTCMHTHTHKVIMATSASLNTHQRKRMYTVALTIIPR